MNEQMMQDTYNKFFKKRWQCSGLGIQLA
jgi:hypothetical protein